MSPVYDWFGSHTKNHFLRHFEIPSFFLNLFTHFPNSEFRKLDSQAGNYIFAQKFSIFAPSTALICFQWTAFFLSLHFLPPLHILFRHQVILWLLFLVSFPFSFPSIYTHLPHRLRPGKRKCNNNWNNSETIHSRLERWILTYSIVKQSLKKLAAPPFLFFSHSSQLLNFPLGFIFRTNRENSLEPLWRKTGKIKEKRSCFKQREKSLRESLLRS